MKFLRKTNLLIGISLLSLVSSPAFATEYPDAIKHWQNEGVSIVSQFDAPNGMQGYTGMYEGVGITLYLLPDKQHVVWGELYDKEGKDLSAVALEKAIYAPMAAKLWERMESSQWIQDGDKDAKQIVYVFMDANCPYCNEFWQAARPYVDSGKVQLRHIMVGILADDSNTKAATILSAKSPSETLKNYEASGGKMKLDIPATLDEKTLNTLESHLQIMDALGASATPAIYYLNKEGRLQQQLGMPDDTQLKAIMGQ